MTAVSFAAGGDASLFPYNIEFDVDQIERVCYAGHPGGNVLYKDGIAVTPDTRFRIEPKADGPSDSQLSDLSVTVSLVYENDKHSGSYKEIVKKYDKGTISLNEDYRLLSDNAAASLEDRDRLYSDQLSGMEMTVESKGRDLRKKTVYLYMCSDDVYSEYYNAE